MKNFYCFEIGTWDLGCKDCRRDAISQLKLMKGKTRSTRSKKVLSLAIEAIKEVHNGSI